MRRANSLIFKVVALLLTFQLFSSSTWGQVSSTRGDVRAPQASQYTISLGVEERLLIDVNVWGEVNNPGQYRVPDDTDLISLISWAGGPKNTARMSNVKIIRSSNEKPEVVTVDMKKYIKTADPDLLPPLLPGDTIIVTAGFFSLFSRVVRFIADAVVIANLVIILTR